MYKRCPRKYYLHYILKKPLIQTTGRDRRAMVIAVGGSKSKKMFEAINLTMKYYFDALDIKHVSNLFVNKIEKPGQIKNHKEALEHAVKLAKQLVDPNTPLPEEPTTIQLT